MLGQLKLSSSSSDHGSKLLRPSQSSPHVASERGFNITITEPSTATRNRPEPKTRFKTGDCEDYCNQELQLIARSSLKVPKRNAFH
ncbi:hypothetical protein AVEN_156008-1 [Araneus ventricosus]|uniref:Uncharacterized protein n=1 Tax=Araneus ventricosus TaxID=182803 RepID=A0A4Y2RJZ1_ARAVE|nr:hypothetical protein AVEN_156008-1 [Araneus ventricosus]